MERVTPRTRFEWIISHQEADRVLLDLAGPPLSAIDPNAVTLFREARRVGT